MGGLTSGEGTGTVSNGLVELKIYLASIGGIGGPETPIASVFEVKKEIPAYKLLQSQRSEI
jgi:hypothetical protein